MVSVVDFEHSQESGRWVAKTLGTELVRFKILDTWGPGGDLQRHVYE